MACLKNGQRCSDAAARNGIWGLGSRVLNIIGSWDTYKDLSSVDQIPARIIEEVGRNFGITGLGKGTRPTLTFLGMIAAVHLSERATGALATFGMRMAVRGQPVAKWRNIIVRESPLVQPKARALSRMTGNRLLNATGYYFHDRGTTWHAQSFTFDVKGVPRTVTQIRSYSMPYREHFFDRPLTTVNSQTNAIGEDAEARDLPIQRVIDVVTGYDKAENISGYIGGSNELENTIGLGAAKRLFFAANWYLLDESERDVPSGGPDFVDYDALAAGKTPGAGRKTPTVVTASSGTAIPIPGIPGMTATTYPSSTQRPQDATAQAYANHLFGMAQKAVANNSPFGGKYRVVTYRGRDPLREIPQQSGQYKDPATGKQFPAVVTAMSNASDGAPLADVLYFDPDAAGGGMWQQIDNEQVRREWGSYVEAGQIPITKFAPT